ncbi:hypothetical protein CSUI_009368 [Cystoisospora suis]|uniref:Uncharacterized protein n=1 Tax=Cystoisospora suis TaxID=483139 RepID=A0A2C6KK10_9APIC|nr:hypothetical protein CSUI_009368 [Cystoisospora suis]
MFFYISVCFPEEVSSFTEPVRRSAFRTVVSGQNRSRLGGEKS